jgi:hypothetical protein
VGLRLRQDGSFPDVRREFVPRHSLVHCAWVGKQIVRPDQGAHAHLMICRWVRFDATVHGSSILVIQRFAGQEEKAWYLRHDISRNQDRIPMAPSLPARINMIETSGVSKVRSIDRELVIGVEFRLHGIVACPWILATAL